MVAGWLFMASAALIVSTVGAVISAVAAAFTGLALHQSRRANHLAGEANRLAHSASDQAKAFFEDEGPRSSVRLTFDGDDVLAVIKSVGRLDVVIQDVLFESVASGARLSAEETAGYEDWPISLRPTETYEQYVSRDSLARASGQYGGVYEWRAAAVISGEATSWSEACAVTHPVEPRLEEQLADFNRSLWGPLWQRLRDTEKGMSADEVSELAETHAELRDQLQRLRAKFEASNPGVRQHVATMLTNAERRYGEVTEMLRARR
jgi:hypothetical protein